MACDIFGCQGGSTFDQNAASGGVSNAFFSEPVDVALGNVIERSADFLLPIFAETLRDDQSFNRLNQPTFVFGGSGVGSGRNSGGNVQPAFFDFPTNNSGTLSGAGPSLIFFALLGIAIVIAIK